jgi:hypothetical protein
MRRNSAAFSALLVVAAALLAPGCGGRADVDPFPADGFFGSWRREGATQVLRGADLYGRIDGGAEVFLELGFDRLLVQAYRSGDGEIEAELYRMRDPLAALGIYLAKCGEESPAPGLEARNTAGPHQLQMVKGSSYLAVNVLSGEGDVTAAMVALARKISTSLPDGDVEHPFAILPAAGRVPGSERVIRGPFTLDAVYTLGEGDILSLGGRLTAVAAAYRDADGHSWSEIAATYPDEEAAAAAFGHLAGNLDPYLKVLETSPRRVVFSDYADRFGEVARRGSEIHARVNLAERPANDLGE